MFRTLLVDDDQEFLRVTARLLEPISRDVVAFAQPRAAVTEFREGAFDVIVCDMKMPGMSGIDLLREVREHDQDIPVLLITGNGSLESAIEAIDHGASGYVLKPFTGKALRRAVSQAVDNARLRRENRSLRRALSRENYRPMVGESDALEGVREETRKFATADVDVLIVGETGTGKELVARQIHSGGSRASRPFVPVDCGAIPESLFESEFFGHEKGAFTGATEASVGLFELADGGVLFLDEVLSLPPQIQTRLLRALQQRQIRRVGGKRLIDFNVQVVAACNRDPVAEINSGGLREDLYYRLNVGRINLPPLRERTDDIPRLAQHFVEGVLRRTGRTGVTISPEAHQALLRYPWPGNVRELENVMVRAVALTESGSAVRPHDLPREIVEFGLYEGSRNGNHGHLPAKNQIGFEFPEGATVPFQDVRDMFVSRFERSYLDQLLQTFKGDAAACMDASRIPRATFYRMLKKHDLDPSSYRD